MSGNKPPLEVLVFGRAGFVGSFVFSTSRITVGRHVDAMVRLEDPAVSLKHAELFLEGGLFRIKDLGSRTGTRVNGRAILPRQPLEPADEILIGPFRLRATVCEPDATDDPASRKSTAPQARTRAVETPMHPPPYVGPSVVDEEPITTPKGLRAPISETTSVDRVPPLPPPSAPTQKAALARATVPERAAVGAKATTPEAATTKPRPPPLAPEPAPLSFRPAIPEPEPPVIIAADSVPATRGAPNAPKQHASPPPVAAMSMRARGAPKEPPPARVASIHDEDDDEDDEYEFVPSFDLLTSLARGGLHDDPAYHGLPILPELIHHRAGRVISVRHAHAKGPLTPHTSNAVIGTFEGGDALALYPDACRSFSIREGGRALTEIEVSAKREGTLIRLTAAMQAHVFLDGDDEVLVHWVTRAPVPQTPSLSLRPDTASVKTGAFSFAVHLAMFVILAFLIVGEKKADDINAGRFAKIDMKELELEPPPPAPPPVEAQAPTNAPAERLAPSGRQEPVVSRNRSPADSKVTHSSSPESSAPSASTQKILSALGGAPGTLSAISLSNLDALPVGAGDFKVSGAVGKAPGDTLRIAAVGGGGIETKSASELGGNNLGRVHARGGDGPVRGRVSQAPPSLRGEGHLDRGEIQKVVNAHIFQVSGCFERQLAKDPSLGGKVSFDWVIGPSGLVSNTRVGRSTLRNSEVASCIQAAIQGWKFPSPSGGSVTVTYPFTFSTGE